MGLDMVSAHEAAISDDSHMRAPLLSNWRASEDDRSLVQAASPVLDHLDGGWPSRSHLFEEARRLFDLTGPIFILYLCQTLIPVVSMAFVGHEGSAALAGSAIAVTMYNVIGRAAVMGLAGGLQTLSGQAYGAGEYMQLGELLQRGIVILNLVAIPLALMLLRLDSIMLLLGQDPDLAARSQVYAVYLVPGLFSTAWQCPLELYLQTQGRVVPTMIASMIVLVLHLPLNFLLVHTLGYGFTGPAMATSLSTIFYSLFLICYICCSGIYRKTWKGLSWACFRKWGQFFKLAIPSSLMTCLEWWCFELSIVVAGLLPNPAVQVAALTITINLGYIIFMLPLGMSTASSIRVSNELGAANPAGAKLVATTVLLLSSVLGVFFALLLTILQNWLPTLFTNAGAIEIRHLASALIPILALSTLADFVQLAMAGVLRGAGRQEIGAAINLGACYFLSFPVSIFLSLYYHFGVQGIWVGLMLGAFTKMALLAIFTARVDWRREARDAKDRLAEEGDDDDLVFIKRSDQ